VVGRVRAREQRAGKEGIRVTALPVDERATASLAAALRLIVAAECGMI
jgi:translation initiation factor 1 (eIF-1/SUI1)